MECSTGIIRSSGKTLRDSYAIIAPIGQGSFGLVVKAKHLETGKIVAIKRIALRKDTRSRLEIIRETFALQNVEHRNVVRLVDVLSTSGLVCIVMEFVETDLKTIIDDVYRPLNDAITRFYFSQLLHGVAYLHLIGIMHRDIKPSNILVAKDGTLKISDFGQSCLYFPDENREYENQVASRWYRAPELLYGSVHYDPKVDLWACGCVLAELLNGSPLFAGHSDMEQMGRIAALLGAPNEENWKEWHELPDSNKIAFENSRPTQNWQKAVASATVDCIDLLQSLLEYSPQKRLSAQEALKHPYLTDCNENISYVPPLRKEKCIANVVLEYETNEKIDDYFVRFPDL
ncbi:hypothetical protein AB6A40_002065 [Gnathostoma spinigerum]|uniref:Protein kinase domain-containing protein n=1 Tax=Gnathostoma spinigerum TaxID=75299 RepID=A0ABD6EDA7_9BILA